MSTTHGGVDTGEGLYLEGELRQTANRHVEAAKDKRPVFSLGHVLAPVGTRKTMAPHHQLTKRSSERKFHLQLFQHSLSTRHHFMAFSIEVPLSLSQRMIQMVYRKISSSTVL